MALPFSPEAFTEVFITYNQAIWPAQAIAWILGFAAVATIVAKRGRNVRIALGILALLWAWTGVVYHAVFFAEINRAAYVFGLAFLFEAAAFAYFAARPRGMRFLLHADAKGVAAWALIVYALIIYPLTTTVWTHPYPATPMFGVTPCATVIFTFGVLLLAKPPMPRWIFLVPGVWAIVGGSAAIFLGVREDWMLFGALICWIVIARPWQPDHK